MSGYPLVWVDAFTDRPGGGNPAAVCILERRAPAEAMQALASEMGLSETAFVWPLDGGAFSLRWFTPTVEVDLCGHATLASAHAMRQMGLAGDTGAVFRTRSGELHATFDGNVVALDFPLDDPRPIDPPAALVAMWPVLAAALGRDDVLVEVADAEAVRRAVPDLAAIARVECRGVILTAPGEGDGHRPDYVLRFFAPRAGVPEDPVTGSAQCLLGPWWSGRLGRTDLQASQLSARGGRLWVDVGPERVRISGPAVTVLTATVEGPMASALDGAP